MASIGETIRGKYRLVRLLGDGGMGSVYEAIHEGLGTRVAIKVLHSDLARRTGLVDRFLQEARVAAQIRSPHVVQVTDVDRTDTGEAYIVMELLEGEPLSATLDRQGKVPVEIACEYARQILLALEAAHALGVVHRDLKPENVFVTYAAGKPVLKLIDFGIAKLRSSAPGERSMTVAGVTMGTAEYMAPEQAYSADRVDARSDLYAVGVMLFELIGGARPVAGSDARAIAVKVERGEVTPLVHLVPEVRREIAGLVHRAMAPRPELRFGSAAEMRLALESALTGRRMPTVPLAAHGQTVQVAPVAAAFVTGERPMAPIEPAPRTERAGPIVIPPMAQPPRAPSSVTAALPPPSPRRKRGGGLAWAIAGSLVLGAVVAGTLVVMSGNVLSSSSAPVPTAPATPPPTTLSATPPAPIAPTVTSTAPVAPLATSPGPAVPAAPHSGGGRAPHAPSASPTDNPFGGAFPLPAFPFPLDGGAIVPFTIPSTFPTALPSGLPFSIPGFPTATPKQPDEPPPAPSASTKML